MGILVEAEQFFAPVQHSVVEVLFSEHDKLRARIEEVSAYIARDAHGILSYFVEASRGKDGRHFNATSFEAGPAIRALDAAFWARAMALTDVLETMPAERANEWRKMIRENTAPAFNRDTVIPTMQDLLAARERFLAERIDGLFRALSGEHVTNSPMAFGKRFIIARMTCEYGYPNSDRVSYIHDLRCVIAKFMGREQPPRNLSDDAVRTARHRPGEWITLDGGALRLRGYKVGTAHLEVHPEMAYRLNAILASLYPAAIPAEFRTKPRKTPKEFVMHARPLPFAVLELLHRTKAAAEFNGEGFHGRRTREIPNTLQFAYCGDADKAVIREAERVLESIGGVKAAKGGYYQFDYPAGPVVADIVCTGCLPDQHAHQFYPTPDNLAEAAAELLQAGPDDTILEPSAGLGHLADCLPRERVHCVEISPLHCAVLQAKGYRVDQGDFLTWASRHDAPSFGRIAMNPPFSAGRWQAHLQAAAGLLLPGGRLVAILPASAKGKDVLPGWSCEWSQTYTGHFADTGVAVVILTAARP